MRYDPDDIQRRVEKRKKSFIAATAAACVSAACSVAAALLVPENKFVVPGVLIIALLVAFEFRLFRVYRPTVIFSKEIEGVNIKEHEYVSGVQGPAIRKRFPNLPRKQYKLGRNPIASRIVGIVYLRLESGEIEVISPLNKVHMDFYEDGDLLNKPAGAKYPQVKGRDVDTQPCPICGAFNSSHQTECSSCGLLIVRERR